MWSIIVAVSSMLAVALTVFVPTVVQTRADMEYVSLGLPYHFVVQDVSRLSYGEWDSPPLPQSIGFMSPWEFPFYVDGEKYWKSVGVMFAIWEVLMASVLLLRRHWKPRSD